MARTSVKELEKGCLKLAEDLDSKTSRLNILVNRNQKLKAHQTTQQQFKVNLAEIDLRNYEMQKRN